jgi:hypothetical protein
MLEEKPLSDALARFKLLEGVEGRSDEEPVEWETAYAIWEIVRSLRKIDCELIPSILSASAREEAEQALHEIREELRHVLYHIEDSAYISVISSS